jgi:hypothetical protein
VIDPEHSKQLLEQAAMERLRGWLSCEDRPPAWSGSPNFEGSLPWSEVVAILAGIDPEMSASDGAEGLSLLPGALHFYGFSKYPKDESGRWSLNAGVAAQTGMLIGLKLTTMPPKSAMLMAKKAGVPIPWLEVAISDHECRKYLPQEFLRDRPQGDKGSFREAQRIKRQNQIQTDDKRKLIDGVGYQVFLKLNEDDFRDCRNGKGNVKNMDIVRRIQNAIQEAEPEDPTLWPVTRTLRSRVKAWRNG